MREPNQQEPNSSVSPAEADPYTTKNNVKIIQKEKYLIPQNKVLKTNDF